MNVLLALLLCISTLVSLSSAKCGTRKHNDDPFGRIVGGQEVKHYQFPWVAYLEFRYKEKSKSKITSCGGSIIDDHWIVTAAHCMYTKDKPRRSKKLIRVAVGIRYANDQEAVDMKFAKPIPHRGYLKDGNHYDVLLVRTTNKIRFNDRVQPVCFEKNAQKLVKKKECYVAGFGRTDPSRPASLSQLMKAAKVSITDDSQCSKHMLCASGKPLAGRQRESTCLGDSGSPLFCRKSKAPNQFVQVGVVSYGYQCGSDGDPTYYASLDYVHQWIRDKIKK